jgi:hypothetical protein
MAHMWVRGKDEWGIAPLNGEQFVLTREAAHPIRVRANGPRQSDVGLLVRRPGHDGKESWLLLSLGNGLHVNGSPLPCGMRVLRDRDNLHVEGAGHLFFSTERLARVEPYSGPEGLKCGRCRRPMEPGRPAVLCPNCTLWHHEDPERRRRCWTYTAHCARCPQPTDLDAGYRWTPEEL